MLHDLTIIGLHLLHACRRRTPLAGEIGFSVGRVYTSLSGWTGERTAEAHGTSQLVLLALWLGKQQTSNYARAATAAHTRTLSCTCTCDNARIRAHGGDMRHAVHIVYYVLIH